VDSACGPVEHVTAPRALELFREHGYCAFEPRAAVLVETESAAEACRASHPRVGQLPAGVID